MSVQRHDRRQGEFTGSRYQRITAGDRVVGIVQASDARIIVGEAKSSEVICPADEIENTREIVIEKAPVPANTINEAT